jgi:cytochrome P450
VTLPFESIPRPTAISRLGVLGDWLGVQNARDTIGRVRRYGEQCGPLARVQLGPKPLVVISEPSLIAEVLSKDETNHKGLVYGLTRVVLNNVLLLNGSAWAEHRRRYAEVLQEADWTAAMLGPTSPIDGWLERLAALPPGSPVLLDRLVPAMIGDLLGHLLCGQGFPAALEPERQRIQHELAAIGIDIQCRPWAYLSWHRFRSLRQSVSAVKQSFAAVVQRRLAAGAAGADDNDVLAVCVRRGLLTDEIVDMLVNLFFTGHDVVSATLSFCLHLLAGAPEAQEGLLADAGALERVLLESLRMFPGYALFAREATADITVSGTLQQPVRIPAGTMLIVAPAAVHRLERHFAEPDRFWPDRWLADVPAAGARGGAAGGGPWHFNGSRPFLPFGGGRRACLASRLVLPVLRQLVLRLHQQLQFRPEPGHTPHLAYWGSVYAENGLPVRVRPRLVRHPAAYVLTANPHV